MFLQGFFDWKVVCFRKGNWHASTYSYTHSPRAVDTGLEDPGDYNPDWKKSIKFYIVMYLCMGFPVIEEASFITKIHLEDVEEKGSGVPLVICLLVFKRIDTFTAKQNYSYTGTVSEERKSHI